MKLTAKLKICTHPTQNILLLDVLERCNQACNWISEQAWEHRAFSRKKLHKWTYYEVRERFGLMAQMAARCIAKVLDSYKLDRRVQRVFKRHGAIALDSRLISFSFENQTFTIATLQKRQRMSFVCGPRQQQLIKHQKGETKLCYKKGQFYLLSACDRVEAAPFQPKDVLGVDMGIATITVDSDGSHYGQHVRQRRARHQKTRRSLQKTNTKSAKRKLKKRAQKEKRFSSDVNHCISKQLVANAKRTRRAISLEDLTGIRVSARASRALRQELNSWAFYDLRQKIEYKAALAGVMVFLVDPRYTSQTCSRCGHRSRSNRKSQAAFSCKSCGMQMHADQNAAINVAAKGAVNLPNGVQLKLFSL